ncbi:MAG: alpha/beta fold hydrolase [Pseudomonadota bacterium]|nr:alpha/beta fold hydrolase [Pseudomonadota bacterium]
MLARIQQIVALSLLAMTVAIFAIGAELGSLWLGLGFLAFVLLGYAAVLALEFAWLLHSYDHDDAARPRPAQLLRAWAAEVSVAPRVFLWRQPFRSGSEPDHVPATSIGRRGVLFVHGFFCNRGLWNPWLRRLRRSDVPFVAVSLEPIFGSIDDYREIIDAGARRLAQATGLAPVIVAHSMGGLAVRAWLAADDQAPLHRLVTIASPHAGTRLGRHGRGLNIGQMRLDSEWLAQLANRESAASRGRFVCFWSHCDNIVFPTRSATLLGADNRHLEVTPHVQMVDHPAVFEEVLRALGKAA